MKLFTCLQLTKDCENGKCDVPQQADWMCLPFPSISMFLVFDL